ncbi:hypothetical protein Y032_0042g700 [Ancylostoma ceylanicum]|uniref:Uncharacterized protein n=1 Tax=Ancylostoma ceylanicum TaxID=53326 RepID=A0A016UFK2_9BILA|nr:hypothetical protein Y032_0042g700 [Ancylostoma ceylanicum]
MFGANPAVRAGAPRVRASLWDTWLPLLGVAPPPFLLQAGGIDTVTIIIIHHQLTSLHPLLTEHTASCPSVSSLLGSLSRFGQPMKVHYCDAASGRGVPELLDHLVDSLIPGRDGP